MGGRRARTEREWSVLVSASEVLLERVPRLTDQLIEELLAHSPQFDLAVPRDEHWQQINEAMRYGVEALAATRSAPRRDLQYAERLGRRRAEQGLPLDLVLYAYRHAGYLIWDQLLEIVSEKDPDALQVLVHLASHMWEGVDRQASTVADAYRGTEQEMRRRSDERVQALLDALLEGRTTPGLAASAAAGLDLPEQGRYAVVVVRVERAAGREPFHRVAASDGLRFFWRMRTDYEIAVVALGAEAGLTELASALHRWCPGPGGISPVVPGLADLGLARRLAETALRTCGPDADRIVRLDERLPTAMVVSQPELAARLIADVFGPLLDLDPTDRAVLLETLDAWLECGGSAGRAATRLYCHRNTVFNRLRRLEQLTSRSLGRPRDLIEMTLALDAFRLTPG
ncbi:helix-turn-helix domain-containing protein [Streptomyces lunaelactis]|uniref:PucR family transcriptional regulator n=1 Tax=Streptomyces lunaelactis TaxID=1535768 RepID=UPI001584BB51|nr:helix-turn-helix domain-containing protein [Streptomyces lunaelactis]NUK11262.1 helix-turn-helix domain-containing protein [Streptomyces lunaelactis]NUK23273.1 helix-turn-helix domain-containing protein [Streptomyces lunaelactis]NUK53747.1 helix-turn-helix domain-containing protein [Streptomyces lunaelactis]NUK64167.1 helix-turn-helix domain-containing protein [Streptomyces lunaelactis]NUL13164.1 helix-turn-helix domain-containing protein [Streptomyces lunaelactis]